MKKSLKLFFPLLLIIFCCGCATIYNPATQRNEFIFIGTQEEIKLGQSLSQEINSQYMILHNQSLNSRLRRIGDDVARASDRQDLRYEFHVVDSDELNAFALPGGFIYVNKALLDEATDDELACVLAHEVGHVAARHSIKKLQAALGYQLLLNIAFGESQSGAADALNIVFNAISLGYSRKDENLADKLSVKYSHKAGYEPNAMISFFYKLKAKADKAGHSFNLVFFSSHPPIEERIKNVQQEIELLRD